MVVVDDDPKVRLLLERAFRAPEFETHTFATGAAALSAVAEIRPDCVVSDILMPDMDGESFLRALRTIPGLERVPFVAVSAVRSEARIRAVLDAGAAAFLLKPFPLRDLLEKVRWLLDRSVRDRPAPERPAPEKTSDYTTPTRPVSAAPHTTSTAAIPRRGRVAPAAAPSVRVTAPVRIVVPTPVAAAPTPPAPAPRAVAPPPSAPAPAPATAVAAVSAPAPAAPVAPPPAARAGEARRIELQPPGGLGFGRFTRVEARGRSFVVLTEAVAQPKFTVTTVITEKGLPLRKVETALPHPLAREDDRDTVRRQLDTQHDDVLRRLDDLVLDSAPRRVVWSDQSRSVDAHLLAWTMSAVAQLAEAEAGTDETTRLLHTTHEQVRVEEDALRAFHVTSVGRVVVDPDQGARIPRRGVRAVAAWCAAFATAALQADEKRVVEPVRQATRRHAVELERLGFYDRLQGRMRA
jgi:CheY-like chemotaxis protein